MLRVFFRCPIFKNPRFVGFVWFATALVACLLKLPVGRTYNNFMIYRASFFHALELKDLYIYYPNEYHDRFLYVGESFEHIGCQKFYLKVEL